MGFQINDNSNGNPLGTIKIVEPEIWRGATHFFNNDNYNQNFYINCAARPQIQQNHTHFNPDEEYNNPDLDIYDSINEYCVNYNNKWYKPLSIVEMPTFDISKSQVIADHYDNSSNVVVDTNKLNGDYNDLHYGFYIEMLNFGGSKNGYSNQRLQYNQGDTYFQVNRDNDVNGDGILLWRIRTTAHGQNNAQKIQGLTRLQGDEYHLNPGKVVIFDTS